MPPTQFINCDFDADSTSLSVLANLTTSSGGSPCALNAIPGCSAANLIGACELVGKIQSSLRFAVTKHRRAAGASLTVILSGSSSETVSQTAPL